jgi:hypothetical protein
MTTQASFSRRDFIKISSVAGAGLLLSFYLPSKDETALAAAGESFAPNAWLKIDND